LEKMMVKTNTIGKFALVMMVLGLPLVAVAQWTPVNQGSWGQPAQTNWGNNVPGSQGRAVLNVSTGTVLDIQATSIEVSAPVENRAIGGVVGGLLGAALGKNESSWQGQSVVGALGAFLGDKLAVKASSEMRPAVQLIVHLDNGNTVAVVQEETGASAPLRVGDKVALVGNSPVRVVAFMATALK
jgi:outer membrane lipoprotein SlyB